MRIAFVGKGGSGKTTASSLFIRHLAAGGLPVLAIDADINQHLADALGYAGPAVPGLGLEMKRIKDFLRGSNPRISSAEAMIKTTPPGRGSRLIPFGERNELFSHFERNHDAIRMMAVGPFTEEDLGVKCYHSKTGAVELILNHLIDGPGEYVVVDMTAGSDSFASGMFTKFDLTLLVVEPTLKSVSVYQQYKAYAAGYGLDIKVLANKIENEDDLTFVRGHVGEDLIAALRVSPYVKAQEKGRQLPFVQLEKENREALDAIRRELDGIRPDKEKRYEHATVFHAKNAAGWANAEAGEDLALQIDPEFDWRRT